MKIAGFAWDTGNWPKCGKHGLSRAEIEEVFARTPAVLADPFPEEVRMRAIGTTAAGRHVFVVFQLREIDGQTKLRPSAPATCIRRRSRIMNAHPKPLPPLTSDAEAEAFVETADLSEYDLSGFTPMRFEIEPKAASLNMRLPAALLDAVKAKAKASGIPYTRYVRMLLETDVARPK